MGSPVVSQLSHDYSLLKSSTPEARNPHYGHETRTHPAPVIDVRKFANPAPLGLCAFALTSFLSNCINLDVGGVQASGISVSLALNYGGIAQVLAGMWYVIPCSMSLDF
jgi:succinate-acetate transporter protein